MSLLIKGVTNFLGLTDTPAAFTGEGGKVAQVKGAEDALEFAAKKLTYTQIYDGAVPSSGNLKPLGSIPYRFELGSTGARQMFVCVYNGDMYVGGGDLPDGGAPGSSKQFWKYNIATEKWTKLANLPGYAGFICRAAYYNGHIYCCANSAELGGERLFDYTIASDSWTAYSGVPANASSGCFICPTAAHLIIVTAPGTTQKAYELEYASLGTWNPKDDANGTKAAQVISDEVYVVDGYSKMRRYDEPTELFVQTAIDKPSDSKTSRMWVEDTDAIWVIDHPGGSPQRWMRSTGAAAFVEQLTFPNLEDCIEGGHGVLPSGEINWYVVFGLISPPTILPYGCYGLVEVAGVWELASQAFIQGDDLVVDAKGVPVHCSVGGELREIVDTYLAMVTIAAETWDFVLSKDYDYHGVDIWRGT